MNDHDVRPYFLNLLKIRLPITGLVSIAHRVAGMLLFLLLPFAIYLLDLSLTDPSGYEQVVHWLSGAPLRLVAVLALGLFVHHLAAGLRVLLLDMEVGVQLPVARRSALLVLVSVAAALLLGWDWL